MHFWISKNGVTQGPYAESQLRSMWQNGAITADCLCWKEGFSSWVPVAAVVNSDQVVVSAKEDVIPQQKPKTKILAVKPQASIQAYTPPELLKIASYREWLMELYVIAAMLTVIAGMADHYNKSDSYGPALIWLVALVCWMFVCYFVYVLMRSMKCGALGAWLCVFTVAFVPFAGIVTTMSIYFMAKKELRNAGVKIGSTSFMKNQIRRMKG